MILLISKWIKYTAQYSKLNEVSSIYAVRYQILINPPLLELSSTMIQLQVHLINMVVYMHNFFF